MFAALFNALISKLQEEVPKHLYREGVEKLIEHLREEHRAASEKALVGPASGLVEQRISVQAFVPPPPATPTAPQATMPFAATAPKRKRSTINKASPKRAAVKKAAAKGPAVKKTAGTKIATKKSAAKARGKVTAAVRRIKQ